jgi:UDP-glucose 4-epimerase
MQSASLPRAFGHLLLQRKISAYYRAEAFQHLWAWPSGEGALSIFIQRALQNLPLEIHGEGTQIRAWCFVEDMIQATMLAMWHPKALGESFNVGNQKAVTTIYGLASTVVRVLESKSKIQFTRRDYADVELRIPSTSKSKKILGFEASVDLEEGILATADYYRQQLGLA